VTLRELDLQGRPAIPPLSPFQQYRGLLNRYLRPRLAQVLGMAVLLLVGIALQLVNPQVIRYFLDTAQSGGAPRSLMYAAGLFIAFAILQQALALAANLTSQNVGWSATNHLRADLALHCLRLDMTFHKQHTPGEMIQRVDEDVTQLANFFSQFTVRVLGNGLLVLGILISLSRENPWLGLGMALYTGLTLLVLSAIQELSISRWAAARQANAEQYGFLEEHISGAEEIRAAGAEPYAMRRLYQQMRAYLEKTRAAFVISNLTSNLTNLVFGLGFAAGLALGVFLYTRGQATLGAAYLIVYYVGMLSDPLQNIREQVQDLQQATASIQRIQALFVLQPQVTASVGQATSLPRQALSVAFSDVSFHYEENENVLEGVSLEIPAGRVLGILGRTGSGKSTLTRLLFRFYDPTQGAIRLNGVDLRQVALPELRQRVAMVTQDVQLFQATLRENLTLFNPRIRDDQINQVLKSLFLWDWVQSLPKGLDTILAAGGQGLSAGEAQLLAFARVFLKDPGLVILDEASARLDPATEALVEQAVDRLFQGRTAVVIAHRLKTVQRADNILILEEGRVVEYGARQVLASDPGSRFYHLLQTGLEEALA